MEEKKNKALENFTQLMIDKINSLSESDSWDKPWITVKNLPMSYNGKPYSAFNSFYLSLVCMEKNFKLPVFVTFDRAIKSGFSINKGQHGFPVEFRKVDIKNENGENISWEDYNNLSDDEKLLCTKKRMSITYTVFNIEQSDFKEIYPEKWEKMLERNEKSNHSKTMFSDKTFDHLIANGKWICPINLRHQDRAYFSPLMNEIVLPEKQQFIDQKDFYFAALHEMSHSTGKMLERDLSGTFGSNSYAKEELVAELTSAVTGCSLGYSICPQKENAQYLKSWLSALNEEPQFLKSIINEVNKASDVILERMELTKEELNKLDHEREGWTPAERAAINKEMEEETMQQLLQECSSDVKEGVLATFGDKALKFVENAKGISYSITEAGFKAKPISSKNFDFKSQNPNELSKLLSGKKAVLSSIEGKEATCEMFRIHNSFRIKQLEPIADKTNEPSLA